MEIIVFHNVLGGINRRYKRGLSGETIKNSFDLFTVPAGKGKLKKIKKKIFDISAVPAGKGNLKKIKKKSSIFLLFPQGRANWRRYPLGYLRADITRHYGKVENCLLTIFSSHPYPPGTGDTPLVISIEN